MEGTINVVEDSQMAQAEKSATHSTGSSQNGEKNVVNLGPRDSLHGRLDVQGDLKIAGNVEGELKASGDITVDSGASIQATIEGANVSVRGQVTGNVTAKKRLTLGGSGHLNGDVKVARLTVEDGATLNGNVTMQSEKG
jgi:cytoskeletal protein CcmA (bactofilin family)